MLVPNGLIINAHYLPAPYIIEVHSPEKVNKVGWLLDSEDFASERLAFNALAHVVAERNFNLEDERDFGHNIYIDDLDEMKKWLAEWWESAILTQGTLQRLKDLMSDAGQPAKIVVALRARMTKLKTA
jgi:hypothetical protein